MTPTPDPRAPLPPRRDRHLGTIDVPIRPRFDFNLEALHLEPGDVAILRTPIDLGPDTLRALGHALKRDLPDHPVLILGPGAEVERLPRAELERIIRDLEA